MRSSQLRKQWVQKINRMLKNKIDGEGRDKSKVKHLLEGIREWNPQVRQPYMDQLTRSQVSHIFKARTRMLDIKNNFRGKYENLTCRACKNAPETQQHILEECPSIHINDDYIVKKRRYIWHRKKELEKKTAKKIRHIMQTLYNKSYSLFQRWDPCDQRRAHTELNRTEPLTDSACGV